MDSNYHDICEVFRDPNEQVVNAILLDVVFLSIIKRGKSTTILKK